MIRVYFVRHGENLANLTKEFSYKKVDYPLTDKGVLQAEQTANFLATKPVGAIFSSPLKRCTQTAEIIAERMGLTFRIEEDLREVNVGSLEGRPVSQALWDAHNAIIRAWCEGSPEARFPAGENQRELASRLEAVLRRILETRTAGEIVVVGHGGLFSFGLPRVFPVLDMNKLLQIPNHNCSISTLDLYRENGFLRAEPGQWAQIDHLKGPAADFVHGVPREGELK